MLFGENRSDMREVFFSAWEKFHRGDALEPSEQLVVDVLHRHPEYHRVVGDRDNADKDWTPEMGETNPFLHMGMHIALAEQVGMDRPAGIRAAYEQLASGMGDTHAAEHEMMECLGHSLWEAQRTGTQPDEAAYLECVQKLVNERGGRSDD